MNIDDSYNFIINMEQILTGSEWGGEDFGIATVLGNWAEHYKSWKKIKFAPFLLVRYEDLIYDTKNSLVKIIDFLNKFMIIEKDEKKLSNVISSCKFEKLSEKEKKEGFFESVSPTRKEKKKLFFYLGKKNDWRTQLNTKIEKKIKKTFEKEMKELKYI